MNRINIGFMKTVSKNWFVSLQAPKQVNILLFWCTSQHLLLLEFLISKHRSCRHSFIYITIKFINTYRFARNKNAGFPLHFRGSHFSHGSEIGKGKIEIYPETGKKLFTWFRFWNATEKSTSKLEKHFHAKKAQDVFSCVSTAWNKSMPWFSSVFSRFPPFWMQTFTYYAKFPKTRQPQSVLTPLPGRIILYANK